MDAVEGMPKVLAAMHRARQSMSFVTKSGTNQYDHYRYSTLLDYIAMIQPALDANGLVVTNTILSSEQSHRQTAAGKTEQVCWVKMLCTVREVTSGQYITAEGYGEGQDRGDKSYYKAVTGARKYALATLFNLATTDDPETDSPGRERTEKPAAKTRTRRPAAPQTGLMVTLDDTPVMSDDDQEKAEQLAGIIEQCEVMATLEAMVKTALAEETVTSNSFVLNSVAKSLAAQYKRLIEHGEVRSTKLEATIRAMLDKATLRESFEETM